MRIHSKSLRVNNSLPAPAKRKSINGQARRETTCMLRFGLRGGGGTRGAPMPATTSPRADLGEEPQLCRPVRPPAVYNCFSSRGVGGWGGHRRAGSRKPRKSRWSIEGNHERPPAAITEGQSSSSWPPATITEGQSAPAWPPDEFCVHHGKAVIKEGRFHGDWMLQSRKR